MRVTRALKLVTVSGVVSSLLTISLWSLIGNQRNGEVEFEASRRQLEYTPAQFHIRTPASVNVVNRTSSNGIKIADSSSNFKEIACIINDDYPVKCKKEGELVYMPFDFLKDYFEVYGELETGEEGTEHLLFHHSNSIVHPPRPTYTPNAMFMAFDHYNVENRDRVKCVTASEGVPLTTQWNKNGYHYPIQIAQFALSHHAKHIADGENISKRLVLENAEGDTMVGWSLPDQKSWLKKVSIPSGSSNHVLKFGTSESHTSKGISLIPREKKYSCFLIDLNFSANGSVTIIVESVKNVQFKIHYVFSSTIIAFDGKQNIYYGMGTGRSGEWVRLVRNLKFDLLKGLLVKMKMERAKLFPMMKIVGIQIRGNGMIDNLILAHAVHMEQFYDAANWLVRHQDEKGGWPIMVHRRVVIGVLELAPGWYSAMGQGQSISVLVRAYLDSKNKRYLDAAVRALKLFQIDSIDGGVRACFFGKYYWYEEYPTTPSSFVLNGFIYSLLGLYDLKETAQGGDRALAEKIYNDGMTSLKHMIGMYDSGVGTLYDLRHITAGIEPNRARWDYHTTHINQMLQLMIIDDDEIFKTVTKRWLGYLKGKRSRHN